ncbi:hypothetical protein VTK26DRAFT_9332 [Humicola hyalothermophila]
MGWLSKLSDDRVLLGYLALNAAAWLVGVRYLLRQWRDQAEIKPVQPKTQYITQETEDALKVSTLSTLLGHYNYGIQDVASRILCDRSINDKDTVEVLLRGITRQDYDERLKNLRALAMIADPMEEVYLERFHNWKAYAALVRSLELSLDPEQETLDDEDWDEYPLRDISEKLCLMFIGQLVTHYSVDKLVKARFVEKWLAKQNWGSTPDERQRNFTRYMRRKNNRITDIVQALRASDSGREALEKAGLLPQASHTDEQAEDKMPLIERLNILLSANVEMSSLRENTDAQRMRHRHREAMVINDGTRPVNSDDIIQRDPDSPS